MSGKMIVRFVGGANDAGAPLIAACRPDIYPRLKQPNNSRGESSHTLVRVNVPMFRKIMLC